MSVLLHSPHRRSEACHFPRYRVWLSAHDTKTRSAPTA